MNRSYKQCPFCFKKYVIHNQGYTVFCPCGTYLTIKRDENKYAELKYTSENRIKPNWKSTSVDWVKVVQEKKKEFFKKDLQKSRKVGI